MRPSPIIRASEVGHYAYCARAWWLTRVRGMAPENLQELATGRRFHAEHGRSVARAMRIRRSIPILVGLAVLCLTLARLLEGGH